MACDRVCVLKQKLTNLELISDRARLATLSCMARSEEAPMACHCCDSSGQIAGILVARDNEEACSLCEPCLQQKDLQTSIAL